MHRFLAYAALVVGLFFVAACNAQPPSPVQPADSAAAPAQSAPAAPPRNSDGYVDLQVDQLRALLAAEDVTLVNVHIPYEGELPDTDLFIPFDQIQAHTAELPDKDAPIVLYCRSGAMSTQAAKALVGLGYTHIYELDGGFSGWQAAGYEVVNKQ